MVPSRIHQSYITALHAPSTRDLDRSRPHRFVLLNIPLVIWWDSNAASWRVFEDVCPHRLVPLRCAATERDEGSEGPQHVYTNTLTIGPTCTPLRSEGRINKAGLLECGYHGWAFNSQGRCEVVPQQGKSDTPRACAVAFHAAERQGLMFVLPRPLPSALLPNGAANGCLGEALAEAVAEETRIPLVPELDEPNGKWIAQDVWRDLPYDWSTLMENVLDASHVPFTHHASMSNRNTIGLYDLKLVTPLSERGFTGVWKTGPRAGKLGPQSTVFTAPAFMRNRLDAKGFSAMTVVYAVPMRPGKCRLINRNILRFNNPIPQLVFSSLPDWWSHVSSHVLLEDDQIFLHLGEEELARRRAAGLTHSQVCYMPSQADTYVIAFNRWIQKYGGGGPFGGTDAGFVEALGARLSRKELLDRYSQHTENCATCQRGLKLIAAVRAVAGAVQLAAGAMSLFCAAVGVAAASTATAAGAAAAAAAPGDAVAAVGSALVGLAATVAGPLDPTGVTHMVRAAVWALGAAAAALAVSRLEGLRRSFYEGVYPPPRNLKP
ncbi:hypothetical protein VOLCADRAFT_87282 [Volvox carteri f. nagariensis]|uniref:Rieske domain-containing protein n=1 Tax=Volvox carteri f. nagariensis TaxID=3068 RepID=D8TKX6_VOLCA|nr:uncharacterized protein VOLCADRAFT_87282 [Volvox carteri f. nagariensis]EFJ51773.1 hypothetical protein VOLCADRAFT_87282 [Volvox carteri f. nagariensis]|eukprot:XP_002947183.1 hypothetical protein VOLCADRAFT_87282 [Volvox carteri f. nagariensis]